MPCPKDYSRVDITGRAYAGSQRQIQTYVNERAGVLNTEVAQSLSKYQVDLREMRWTSPLSNDSYSEYRDAEFLERVGLSMYASQLIGFWPSGGPCWDALARTEDGCILIEAKSHVDEIRSSGCKASSTQSRKKIMAALAATKTWLGVPEDFDWAGPLYQSANRYAFLYFLREIARVPAFLVTIYFVGDPHPNPARPTSQKDWDTAIKRVNVALGLVREVPYSAAVFLPV